MWRKSETNLLGVIGRHRAKALRYCGVSVVNVTLSSAVLFIALEGLGLAEVAANLLSWLVATLPAYLLSRYWVWQKSGANQLRTEIIPFWIIAWIGLICSTLTIALLATLTEDSVILVAGSIGAYGVVWIGKYLVLDSILWSSKEH